MRILVFLFCYLGKGVNKYKKESKGYLYVHRVFLLDLKVPYTSILNVVLSAITVTALEPHRILSFYC